MRMSGDEALMERSRVHELATTVATPEFFSQREQGIDQAKAAVEEKYYRISSLDLIDHCASYRFRVDGVKLGALSVGNAWYNAGIKVTMDDLATSYYINIPQTGTMQVDHRGESVDIWSARAAVFQPVGGVRMRTSGDYASYAIQIDRVALENQLEALLGRPVTRHLDLAASLDLTRPVGTGWARLVRLLAVEATARYTTLTNPLIAAALHEAVLTGLLHAADYPERALLAQPVNAWGVTPVYRAIEAMHGNPDNPFTTVDLARVAGCSVRSLQEGFRRHIGLSPLRYLREVRIEHAHHDLVHGHPGHTTVTEIAHRWGFAHLGRFAAIYGATYGRPPSRTLLDSARCRRARTRTA
jgi:AraC-like DNA-binding protein